MNGNMLIKNAAELVTCSGFAAKCGADMSDLHVIENGALVIRDGIIQGFALMSFSGFAALGAFALR